MTNFFCLKEIHSWWNCCGFWIHITITVHLIIFIANQSTFRPRKTFATFLLDAMNLKMVETINWVLFSGFFHPDSGCIKVIMIDQDLKTDLWIAGVCQKMCLRQGFVVPLTHSILKNYQNIFVCLP